MTTQKATAKVEETTEVKGPSRMDLCTKLYEEIFAKGYDLGGKSQRAVFIKRAMEEVGMTKNGANTYYQNLSNAARGQGKYKYNKYESKKGSKADTAANTNAEEAGLDLPGAKAPTKSQVKNAEAQAGATTKDLTKRWQVLDDGVVVDSFSTRAAAKKAATGGLVMNDSQPPKA